jgi:hypothetical protein
MVARTSVHGYGLERAGAQLRGGDHHMIDYAAGTEKINDTLFAGDVGRDRGCTQSVRGRLQALGVARGHDDIGAFRLCQFGGRQTDAGRAPNHHDLPTRKQHAVSSDLAFLEFFPAAL